MYHSLRLVEDEWEEFNVTIKKKMVDGEGVRLEISPFWVIVMTKEHEEGVDGSKSKDVSTSYQGSGSRLDLKNHHHAVM